MGLKQARPDSLHSVPLAFPFQKLCMLRFRFFYFGAMATQQHVVLLNPISPIFLWYPSNHCEHALTYGFNFCPVGLFNRGQVDSFEGGCTHYVSGSIAHRAHHHIPGVFVYHNTARIEQVKALAAKDKRSVPFGDVRHVIAYPFWGGRTGYLVYRDFCFRHACLLTLISFCGCAGHGASNTCVRDAEKPKGRNLSAPPRPDSAP